MSENEECIGGAEPTEKSSEQQTESKMTATEYFKRCLVLLIGLIIMAFGVEFSVLADLGTSPVSSIP